MLACEEFANQSGPCKRDLMHCVLVLWELSFGANTKVFAAAEDYNSLLTVPRKVSKRKNATRNTTNYISLLVYPTNIFS